MMISRLKQINKQLRRTHNVQFPSARDGPKSDTCLIIVVIVIFIFFFKPYRLTSSCEILNTIRPRTSRSNCPTLVQGNRYGCRYENSVCRRHAVINANSAIEFDLIESTLITTVKSVRRVQCRQHGIMFVVLFCCSCPCARIIHY